MTVLFVAVSPAGKVHMLRLAHSRTGSLCCSQGLNVSTLQPNGLYLEYSQISSLCYFSSANKSVLTGWVNCMLQNRTEPTTGHTPASVSSLIPLSMSSHTMGVTAGYDEATQLATAFM